MSLGIKVAELNTLSDGKGITGIRFFNEMEDTNESTNLRKLADVWMSKNRCCQGNRNRSAVSVTRITVDIGHPSQEEEVNTFPEPNLPQNVRFHQTPWSQNHRSRVPNPSRASIAAAQPLKHVETGKNEVLKLDENEPFLPDMRHSKSPTCAEIICDHCRKRHRMQCHRFMCPITESMEHGVVNRRWRSSLKTVEAGVSGRLGSRYRAP